MILRVIVAMGLCLVALPTAAWAGDWPQFRGLNSGIANEASLPHEWNAGKNIRWKVHVPGFGWSSPVVWGEKVFVTTAVSDRQQAPERKGPGGGPASPPDELHRWEVHCLDAMSGKTLWKQVAAERKPFNPTHISNTYASETPVTDGERVYAYFGQVGLYCYDMSGQLLWSRDLGQYKVFGNWGTSSSPALDGDRLFIQCDNDNRSFLVAFDARTGNELWRVGRTEKSTWSTPVVWRNKLRTELVLMGTKRIRSYDPATGQVLWELTTEEGSGSGRPRPGDGKSAGGKPAAGGCKSTPVATRDMIYVGMAPKTHGQALGPMWAVKAGATGDISLKSGESSNAHIAWFRPDAGPHFSSAVITDGLVYVFPPHDGVLRCFDAETGTDVYQRRISGARDFKSSPWVHEGRVFNVDENGVTFVIRAGRDFAVLGENVLDELCWSSPAPAHGAVFLRGVEHLYCIAP